VKFVQIKKFISFFQNANGYNFKSDVYSIGSVACELANGSNTYVDMPFGNLSVSKCGIGMFYWLIYLDALCENSRFRTNIT
jgi:hypothetical protein